MVVIIAISFTMNDKEKSTIEDSSNINITEEYNANHTTNKMNNINNSIERKEDMKLYLKVNNEILTVNIRK